MAIAFDSTTNHFNSATGTTTPISVTVTIVSGQMVLVFSGTNTTGAASTVSSITDTGGNVYVKLVGGFQNTSRVQMDCWICYKASAGATSITVNYSGTPTHGEVSVVQYTGVTYLGQMTTGTLASSTSLSMSSTTHGANSFFAVGFGNQGLGTHAAGTGNLRTSGTSAGTATTAIGMAAMDNTTASQGASLTVAETLGTAGIGAFIMIELLSVQVLVGDEETLDDEWISLDNSGSFFPYFTMIETTSDGLGTLVFTPAPPPPPPNPEDLTLDAENQLSNDVNYSIMMENVPNYGTKVTAPIPPPYISVIEVIGVDED